MNIETQKQLEYLLGDIQMLGTRFEDWDFDWKIEELEGMTLTSAGDVIGWHIQSSFERPDANSTHNKMDRGFGRKWFVEAGTPDTGVVFTAWMALQQIVIHELHESFVVEVNGECVRLLDPHKTLADLAVGSRRV